MSDINKVVDHVFNPPVLTKHECEPIRDKYNYSGVTVGIFKGHSDWFIDKDGVMVIPITHCPYCGIDLSLC